ncbi:MAG: hypothetical protein JWN04_6474 [Myxococcaceae bacterium]|nr:hypothetical protein [Myxococcaceae bacterium]
MSPCQRTRPHHPRSPSGLLLLGLCSALGCGGSGPSTRKEPPRALSDTSFGFVGVEPIVEDGSQKPLEIAPNLVEHMDEIRQALPLLHEAHVSLVMIIQAVKVRDPALRNEVFELVEEAVARGLEVRPVPLLSADDGYFPNATNVDAYLPVVRELVAQWKARGLAPNTLVVDMEPSRDLMAALSSFRLVKALPRHQIDRERYARAVSLYAALVEELHAAGWKVSVTTQATLLADYGDGDDDLRQYFNVVLDQVPWDQVEFQLYRSAYRSQSPGLDSYFVYDFAKKAAQQFPGTPVGVGLGLTHPGPTYPRTATEDQKALREDLGAALAAGVPRERITVYNLKGILLGPPFCDKVLRCSATDYSYKSNEPRSWFMNADGRAAPSESASTKLLWGEFELADKLLDHSKDSRAD